MNSGQAMLEVKDWLLTLRPDLEDISPDLDLVTNRIVDSLAFVELVERLMELSGRELDVEAMPLESFQTLAAIRQHYLSCLDAA